MSKCVIFGAAEIKNYEKLIQFINDDDFIIACDGGLSHLEHLNLALDSFRRGLSPLAPNLIIGDFDSHKKPEQTQYPQAKIIQLPCEKDDTDLFYAAKEGIKLGYKDFLILGAIGNRFDHSLCNISVLFYLSKEGAKAKILDDYSEMELVESRSLMNQRSLSAVEGSASIQIPDTYSYFSLMCVDGNAKGVTIRNAKYPLENAEITTAYQYAISNQVLPGKVAEVSVKEGSLLLVKVF